MHLDHAGGLDQFLDRKDVEIWVHDKELRSAFWSVATGADVGVYLSHYMKVRPRHQHHLHLPTAQLDLNWKTFDDRTIDFCQGITLHHLPGHTDGLIGMQINLPNSGTFFFISDHCHVIENVSLHCPDSYNYCRSVDEGDAVARRHSSRLAGERSSGLVPKYAEVEEARGYDERQSHSGA